MNEDQRFQEWLMKKGPDGRPVWAPEVHQKPGWRSGQVAHFIKGFLQSKGAGGN